MDNKIIQRLYETYSKEIYLYLLSLCRQSAMAEDLLQETFLKAMLALPDGHTNMRAWLYKVARNLCFNQMKHTKKETLLNDISFNLFAKEEDMISKCIEKEKWKVMYKALGQLEGRKREIITLYYFSGIPLKQIGSIMGLSNENVRILSYRAKKELRQLMEAEGYEI